MSKNCLYPAFCYTHVLLYSYVNLWPSQIPEGHDVQKLNYIDYMRMLTY